MIKRILLFMEVDFTSSASRRKFMPWRKLFFLMIQEFFNIFYLAPRLTSIRLSILGAQQIWIEEKRRTRKKSRKDCGFFRTHVKAKKFWLARVLVCPDCECVLAKHQFFIIISRFSRISRNIGFFLGSRDFLQPSKTFYVWTLNPIKSVWGHR